MNRVLLIAALIVVALLVVSVPAGIGWVIQNQAEPALEQRLPGAVVEWKRGWFRSGLAIDDPDIDADFDIRHMSGSPPGWLAIDGRVVLTDPPTAIDIDGHVALGLSSEVAATAPSLTHGERVQWQHESPALRMVARDDTLRATGAGDTLVVADPLGNRLVLANPDVSILVEEVGGGDVRITLTLEGSRSGRSGSRAVVRMDSVDPAALEQFVEGLAQLVSEGREGAAGGLAAVGLLSGWQQLGARGMVVTLDELSLDGSMSLQGRWAPGEQAFTLSGGGDRDALLAWWATLAGLIGGVSPAEARAAAERSLAEMIDGDAVAANGDRLRVSLESRPGTGNR